MPDNIQILCTRDIDSQWLEIAKKNAVDIVCKDFIKIEPVISGELNNIIQSLIQQKDIPVIFTSKNAVRFTREYYIKDQLPNWQIYCLSGATQQEVVKHFSASVVAATARYAHELANIILQKEKNNKIYFFCGDIRREELPSILKGNSKNLQEIIVYETKPDPTEITKKYDGIIFFGPSAVKSFFSVNHISPQTVCFAIGKTTAGELNKFTSNIILSEGMSTEKMITTVTDYFQPIIKQTGKKR